MNTTAISITPHPSILRAGTEGRTLRDGRKKMGKTSIFFFYEVHVFSHSLVHSETPILDT